MRRTDIRLAGQVGEPRLAARSRPGSGQQFVLRGRASCRGTPPTVTARSARSTGTSAPARKITARSCGVVTVSQPGPSSPDGDDALVLRAPSWAALAFIARHGDALPAEHVGEHVGGVVARHHQQRREQLGGGVGLTRRQPDTRALDLGVRSGWRARTSSGLRLSSTTIASSTLMVLAGAYEPFGISAGEHPRRCRGRRPARPARARRAARPRRPRARCRVAPTRAGAVSDAVMASAVAAKSLRTDARAYGAQDSPSARSGLRRVSGFRAGRLPRHRSSAQKRLQRADAHRRSWAKPQSSRLVAWSQYVGPPSSTRPYIIATTNRRPSRCAAPTNVLRATSVNPVLPPSMPG